MHLINCGRIHRRDFNLLLFASGKLQILFILPHNHPSSDPLSLIIIINELDDFCYNSLLNVQNKKFAQNSKGSIDSTLSY